jgi:GNAT superfamily N-acetyltransferase
LTTRRGRGEDAPAVTEIFHLAARQAWAAFLGAARLDAAPRDAAPWADRVERSTFLVTEDAAGLTGFVYYHRAAEPGVGEVDVLYTHPRAWGNGIGRRLLERATWELLAAGYREAVLWTEARNERALAIYQANGWRPDGAVDEREYLGVPIRNLRHRLDLTRHGGG